MGRSLITASIVTLIAILALASSAQAAFFQQRSGEPCLALGAACAAAAEGIARQPEAENLLRTFIEETSASLKALGVRCERRHAAEAIGLYAAEAAAGVARQPEAAPKLGALAELCGDLLQEHF